MDNLDNNANILNDLLVKGVINDCGYCVCHTETEEKRAQKSRSYEDLNLSKVINLP